MEHGGASVAQTSVEHGGASAAQMSVEYGWRSARFELVLSFWDLKWFGTRFAYVLNPANTRCGQNLLISCYSHVQREKKTHVGSGTMPLTLQTCGEAGRLRTAKRMVFLCLYGEKYMFGVLDWVREVHVWCAGLSG
jgi:hypothetical protein